MEGIKILAWDGPSKPIISLLWLSDSFPLWIKMKRKKSRSHDLAIHSQSFFFYWINKRNERLRVGKLLSHTKQEAQKLLKQAALVELASGCIKRDHQGHQSHVHGRIHQLLSGSLIDSDAFFLAESVEGERAVHFLLFPCKCSYAAEAFGWVTQPGSSLQENHHTTDNWPENYWWRPRGGVKI